MALEIKHAELFDVHTIIFIPSHLLYTLCISSPSGGKVSSCILSNTCLGLGVTVIARLEIREEGLQWDNVLKPLSLDDDFHMGYVFMMLIMDAMIYYLVAW